MHSAILFVHLLGFVFWLGTDIGVFVLAKHSERSTYSVETRLSMLRVAMLLDRAPRIAVPVVFATGVWLGDRYGVDMVPPAAGWIVGAIWLAAVLTGIRTEGAGAVGRLAMRAQFAINSLVVLGMGGIAVAALGGAGMLPGWLAVKWLAFAVIAAAAMVLEIKFRPVVAAYGRLAEAGASEAVDRAISDGLVPVYRAVLSIYAATLVAAWFGLSKAF